MQIKEAISLCVKGAVVGIVWSLHPEARVESIQEKLEAAYGIVMISDFLWQNFYR